MRGTGAVTGITGQEDETGPAPPPEPPRLLDEDGAVVEDALFTAATGPAMAPAEEAEVAPSASPSHQEPALLDLPEGMADGPVDHGWAPAALAVRRAPPSPLNWIAGGLALLLLGWLVLSAAAFVQDGFARSPTNGWVTLGVFGAGLAAMAWGAWLEIAALRRLAGVDALRAALADDEGDVEPACRLALDWLDRLPHLAEAASARPAVLAARDILALRAVLRTHLANPLRQAARRLGNRAAVEGGALVAISPSPALDGLLAGLRGLALLRQIATLYGLRPGTTVTVALLRRLAWTATGLSGLDLLGRTIADGTLTHAPVLKQIAAALPGTGLAAIRLKRLADVTAAACSPLDKAGLQ